MLVLSVKVGETIVVWLEDGSKLEITPVKRRGDRMRVGFDGPPSFHVDREPVFVSKQAKCRGGTSAE